MRQARSGRSYTGSRKVARWPCCSRRRTRSGRSRFILYGTDPDYTWNESDDPFVGEGDEYLQYIDVNWGTIEHAREEIRAWGAPSHADDDRLAGWLASYLRRAASPGAAISLSRMNREINVSHVLPAIPRADAPARQGRRRPVPDRSDAVDRDADVVEHAFVRRERGKRSDKDQCAPGRTGASSSIPTRFRREGEATARDVSVEKREPGATPELGTRASTERGDKEPVRNRSDCRAPTRDETRRAGCSGRQICAYHTLPGPE